VETYRNLVRPLALHYAHRCRESAEDLIQVGLLGLIRAAELYRADLQTPFEAFARPHIRGAILHYLRDTAPAVRLPRRQAELQERLSRLTSRHSVSGGPSPSPDQLRACLGVNEEQWRLLLQHRCLNRPGPIEDATLASVACPSGDGELVGARGGPDLETMLSILEPRQRRVVQQVVLAGWSYRRLGGEMQVSPMTVQRLLKRGLDQLRQQLDLGCFNSGDRVDRAASVSPGC
jgi:RNA polymerase sigma-B factor